MSGRELNWGGMVLFLTFPERLKVIAIKSLLIAAFLYIWQIVANSTLVEIPTPVETIRTFIKLTVYGDELYGLTIPALVLASLRIVFIGVLLSFAGAVPFGILIGISGKAGAFSVLLEMIRPIPPLAWIPFGYIIFAGLPNPTLYTQIFIVFLGSFFPVLINTVHGIKMLPVIFIQAAKTLGASPLQILWKVRIPAAVPSIITGMRIGLGVGWMCIVAAEFVGGKLGIGFYIWSVYNIGGRPAEILSGMIAIGLVGFVMNEVLVWLEKKLYHG